MWIYPADTGCSQDTTEEKTPQNAIEAQPVRFSEDGINPSPTSHRKPENQGITPIPHPPKASQEQERLKSHQPKQPDRTATITQTKPLSIRKHSIHTYLFVSLYALGCLMAGLIRALLAESQLFFLQNVLQKLYSTASSPPFELFTTLFLTALLQITLVAFMGFCAFGVPLMAVFSTMIGIGTGLSVIELILSNGIRGIIFYLLCLGIYHAVTASGICILAQTGSRLSEHLFRSTFFTRSQNQLRTKTDTAIFFKRYLCAVVFLILLCGMCTATSGVARRFLAG